MPLPQLSAAKLPVVCFAPPLTDETIAKYEAVIASQDRGPVRDAMEDCLKAVKQWWDLPESTRSDVQKFAIRHRGQDTAFAITPLEEAHVTALWDAVPWPHELAAIQGLFDEIAAESKDLRDAAFHLLWHVTELCHDREPLTQDKLPGA